MDWVLSCLFTLFLTSTSTDVARGPWQNGHHLLVHRPHGGHCRLLIMASVLYNWASFIDAYISRRAYPVQQLFLLRNRHQIYEEDPFCITVLSSTLDCSGLQRLILTGLKLACSPFHFAFTSITPKRGCQQRLNYVMLDLGGPEMLSRQLAKRTLEAFVINNCNYNNIAKCLSTETLQIFSR